MKIFFDTNVYVGEALLGEAAEAMLDATSTAKWRIFVSQTVLEEIERVLVEQLGFTRRLARLTRDRCMRRATFVVEPASHHAVPGDPADSPILRAAIASGADYLVTNDEHLRQLHPYESLRILSMSEYFTLLQNEGHLA